MVRIEDWQKGSQDLKCFVCGMIFRMTWNLRNHMTKDTNYHCHENVLFVEYLFQKSEIWEITWKELLTWRTCQGRAILLPQILRAGVGSISRQGRVSASQPWRHSRWLPITFGSGQIYIANLAIFKIWVFSATFWHEITLYAIDVDKKRFITFFNTLEPLWKTALHRTQLYGTVATVSYLSVQTCSWVEVRSFFLFCGFAQKLWFRLESLRLWYISAW